MKTNVLLFLLLNLLSINGLLAQDDDLERAKNQAQWIAEALADEANQSLPSLLFKCDTCPMGKKFDGDTYLRMDLLRDGDIQLKGDAPDVNTIKIISTIPLKTNRGRLSWIKKIVVDLGIDEIEEEWKEHKDFDSKFDILVESIIVENEEGMFKSKSKATYKWVQKPYITIDLGIGKIKIGMDEVAGPEIQKNIQKYVQELDREFENFLN